MVSKKIVKKVEAPMFTAKFYKDAKAMGHTPKQHLAHMKKKSKGSK